MTVPVNRLLPSSIPRVSGPVFHYTSGAGLIGMVEEGVVWASEAASLNDLAEVRQGWTLIQNWLQEQPDSDAIEHLRQQAARPLQLPHDVFVLCASTEGDDANQWRLYADKASGYAVELNPDIELVVVSDVAETPGPDKPTSVHPATEVAFVTPWLQVLYEPTEVQRALQELVESVESELQDLESAGPAEEEVDNRYENFGDDSYEALAMIAHLIKRPGFAGEHEVRVIATLMWRDRHLRYRAGTHGIVGYARLTGRPQGHSSWVVFHPGSKRAKTALPLRSVRLGPLLSEEHVSTVERLLGRRGLREVEVWTSSVPLR